MVLFFVTLSAFVSCLKSCSLPLYLTLALNPILHQILACEGGIMLTKEVAFSFFNRLREYPDWSQVIVVFKSRLLFIVLFIFLSMILCLFESFRSLLSL